MNCSHRQGRTPLASSHHHQFPCSDIICKHDLTLFIFCLFFRMTKQLRKKLKLKLLYSLIHTTSSPSMGCSSSFPSLISMQSMWVKKKGGGQNLQGLFQLMRFLLDVRLVRFNEGVCPEHIVLYMVHLVGLRFWHWVQRRWLWKVTLINDGNGDVLCACARLCTFSWKWAIYSLKVN